MTDQQHPITPPPELVEEWIAQVWREGTPVQVAASDIHIATQAARWGADQELEACCADIHTVYGQIPADWLRSMRRPKPPSLAKQGCDALDTYIYGNPDHKDKERTYNTIRAALERLQELEQSND